MFDCGGPLQTETMERIRVHIRWMIRRDMPEVMDIERRSFEYPWFEEEFIRCLRQRNCIGMVAEHNEKIVGFMIYEMHKTRLHVLNFAVDYDFRHRCVGRQMIEKLIGKLSEQRRTLLSLEVRDSNLDAQMFFRASGFKATSVLHDFYSNSDEDAILFEFTHDPDRDWQPLVLPKSLEPKHDSDDPIEFSAAVTDPRAHILRCADKNTGCRLSADEVRKLADEFRNGPLHTDGQE